MNLLPVLCFRNTAQRWNTDNPFLENIQYVYVQYVCIIDHLLICMQNLFDLCFNLAIVQVLYRKQNFYLINDKSLNRSVM